MDLTTFFEADTIDAPASHARRPSVDILDAALDRVSSLDFEIPNPFVNHAPMACEALAALGLDPMINDWVERLATPMRKGVQPVTPSWRGDLDWKERFGDYRLLPEWIGYFGRAVDEEGWRTVVEVWVPRLMPGLVAALFHGVIRTSHAVRAIDVADTRARRAELARALGNWAVWFAPGEPIEENAEFDDPKSAAVQVAAIGARCYVTAPSIFNLHGVTGAMAVHLLAGHVSSADAEAAVTQLSAEHRGLYRDVRPLTDDDREVRWGDEAIVAALGSYDAHQIKLVEACRRGFQITSDPGFALAAQTVTSSAG